MYKYKLKGSVSLLSLMNVTDSACVEQEIELYLTLNRRSPTGGLAYGMRRKARHSLSHTVLKFIPRRVPCCTVTVGSSAPVALQIMRTVAASATDTIVLLL
jgi:hypothetical protein